MTLSDAGVELTGVALTGVGLTGVGLAGTCTALEAGAEIEGGVAGVAT